MRTNPFGTRLASIGAYGVLAQRWDNVRASAKAARGHRCRAGRAHQIIAKSQRKLDGIFISRFRFLGEFSNSTDRH